MVHVPRQARHAFLERHNAHSGFHEQGRLSRSLLASGAPRLRRTRDAVEGKRQVDLHALALEAWETDVLYDVANTVLGIGRRAAHAHKTGPAGWICLERNRHHWILRQGCEAGRKRAHGTLDGAIQGIARDTVWISVQSCPLSGWPICRWLKLHWRRIVGNDRGGDGRTGLASVADGRGGFLVPQLWRRWQVGQGRRSVRPPACGPAA